MKGVVLSICLLIGLAIAKEPKEPEHVSLSSVQFFDFYKDNQTEGSSPVPQLECVSEIENSRCDHAVDWARCSNENYGEPSSNPTFECSTSLSNGRTVVLQDANVTYDRYHPKEGEDPGDLIVKNSHCLRYSFKGIDIDAILNVRKLLDPKVIVACCLSSFAVVLSAFFLFVFLGSSSSKLTTSTEALTDLEDANTNATANRRSSAFLQNVNNGIGRLKRQASTLGGLPDESEATTSTR